MPDVPTYNLDDVSEYFNFRAQGFLYKFRYMTADEAKEFGDLSREATKKSEDKEAKDKLEVFLLSFISKVDETAPDFKDIQGKMIAPQWKQFRKMIETELQA